MKKDVIKVKILGAGAIVKESGWRISKYRGAGDKHPTLKIRKIKDGT